MIYGGRDGPAPATLPCASSRDSLDRLLVWQTPQFLPLVLRAGLELSFTEPATTAAQLATRMGPTGMPGLTAPPVTSMQRSRSDRLTEYLELRSIIDPFPALPLPPPLPPTPRPSPP